MQSVRICACRNTIADYWKIMRALYTRKIKAMKEIQITIAINTESDFDKIESAIKKGLYYGLDIRGVCAPSRVESIKVVEINPLTSP